MTRASHQKIPNIDTRSILLIKKKNLLFLVHDLADGYFYYLISILWRHHLSHLIILFYFFVFFIRKIKNFIFKNFVQKKNAAATKRIQLIYVT